MPVNRSSVTSFRVSCRQKIYAFKLAHPFHLELRAVKSGCALLLPTHFLSSLTFNFIYIRVVSRKFRSQCSAQFHQNKQDTTEESLTQQTTDFCVQFCFAAMSWINVLRNSSCYFFLEQFGSILSSTSHFVSEGLNSSFLRGQRKNHTHYYE